MPFHQDYLGVEQPAVGQLIRELRQTLKLTQEKFATQLGVTFPTIACWDNGHTAPSYLALKQIHTLLNQLSEFPDAALRKCSQTIREKYFPIKDLQA
ncbi:helix-turn-helix transcriptional regulator [Nostoc sp. 106C]|uniref:helix-turn-helix domain-containing protein n=1 Tax=Nostoc sp. 106C TaxID=1932667 RepID=UPI000A361A2C|nr:helix-turn-helix transcriptional regulator [Nostoc sp. 106C]OUL35491.1 transcriptional regulator [Nostoc sp. 106C]